MGNSNSTTAVERTPLPDGVRHYETSGFAESWDAYDALTEAEGWVETHGFSAWKQKSLGEGFVTVHAPFGEREQ